MKLASRHLTSCAAALLLILLGGPTRAISAQDDRDRQQVTPGERGRAEQERARRLLEGDTPEHDTFIVPGTPGEPTGNETDELIKRLGKELQTQEKPPVTPPPTPHTPPENPPPYGPPENPPPYGPPEEPPHTYDEDKKQQPCCGMAELEIDGKKGVYITYPITSDPMKILKDLEAPHDPAVGGFQVYLSDGAFFTNQADLAVPALFYDINWTRHWRGDVEFQNGGLLGHGWDFAFNKRIVPIAEKTPKLLRDRGLNGERKGDSPKLMYYNGMGRAELYVESPESRSEDRTVKNFDKEFRAYVTTYKSPPGQFHEIERYVLVGAASDHPFRAHPNVEPTEQIFYVLREKDGTRYVFNCRGQLIYILSRNDSTTVKIRVELQYDEKTLNPLTQNPMLAKIIDATKREYNVKTTNIGRAVLFTNIRCQVKSGEIPIPRIETVQGAGIKIEYAYRNKNKGPALEATTISACCDAKTRRWEYTYNDANLITDIKDPNECAKGAAGKPYLHNEYAGDRVRAQTLGDPDDHDHQEVTLDYNVPEPWRVARAKIAERDLAGNKRDYELERIGDFHVVAEVTVTDAQQKNGGPWRTVYHHNDDTQVTEILYPKGNGITFEYDGTNKAVKLGPIRDKVDAYTYEHNLARGNLVQVTKHGPSETGGGAPTTVSRDTGVSYSGATSSITKYKYDELYNQLIESTDALDNVTSFFITDYTTPKHRGNPLKIQYPAVRRPDGKDGQADSTVARPAHSLTYNKFAQEESLNEGNGRITKYDYYPETGYLKRTDFPAPSTGGTAAAGGVARPTGAKSPGPKGAFEEIAEYDALGNMKLRSTQDGKVKYDRDGFGLIKTKTIDPEGLSLVTKFDYDANGNTTETRVEVKDTFESDAPKPELQPAPSYWQVRTTKYDILNRKIKETLSAQNLTNETTYKYTRAGDVEYTIGPKLDGKTPFKTTYRYDARHLPIETLEAAETAVEQTTERKYDDNGNLTLVETKTGKDVSRTSMRYNGLDRIATTIDPLTAEHHFIYDAAGNVVDLSVQGGPLVLHHTAYDLDAYKHVIRRKAETLAGTRPEVTRWFYSPQLTLEKTVGPNGAETNYKYDLQNRVEYVTDALGNQTHNIYDGRGNLTDVELTAVEKSFDSSPGTVHEQKKTTTTTTGYDTAGRVLRVTTPTGMERRFLDSLGRPRGTLSKTGLLTVYVYDGLGRLTDMRPPLAAQHTSYTDGGLVEDQEGPGGHFKFEYDPIGRVQTRSDLTNKVVTKFRYEGRTTEITDPNGTVVKTTYNAGGLPVEIAATVTQRRLKNGVPLIQGSPLEKYDYDELGRVKRAWNGSEVTREYDGLDRVTEEKQTWSTALSNRNTQTLKYTYDNDFNWTEIEYPELASPVKIQNLPDVTSRENLLSNTKEKIAQIVDIYGLPGEFVLLTNNISDPAVLADLVGRYFPAEGISQLSDPIARLWKANELLTRELEVRYRIHLDPIGRVDSVLLNGRQVASYDYTGVDRVFARRQSNKVETYFSYDDKQQLSQMQMARGSGNLPSPRQTQWIVKIEEDANSSLLTELTPARDGNPATILQTRSKRDRFGRSLSTATSLHTLVGVGKPGPSTATGGGVAAVSQSSVTNLSGALESSGSFNVYDGEQLSAVAEYSGLKPKSSVSDLISGDPVHSLRVDRFKYEPKGRVQSVKTSGASGTNAPGALDSIGAVEAAINQYFTVSQSGEQTFEYDANGNVVYDGRYIYAYDFKNRLVEVRDTRLRYNESARFSYDALNRRIGIDRSRPDDPGKPLAGSVASSDDFVAGTTLFLYDGDRVIAEAWRPRATGQPAFFARYFHGARPGELLRIDRAPEDSRSGKDFATYFAHEDVNGAVRFVSDANGVLRTIQNEAPYGEGRTASQQPPGDKYMIMGDKKNADGSLQSTGIRVPYVGSGTRIDSFAAIAYRDDLKQTTVDYRKAAAFIEQANWYALRQQITAEANRYQTLIGTMVALPIAISLGPAVEVAKAAFWGGAINAGIGAALRGNLSELPEDFLLGAAFGASGGVVGGMGLSTAAKFGAEVGAFTAVGTTWDYGVRGTPFWDALTTNLITSVAMTGAAHAIGHAGQDAKGRLLGTATEAAEALPELPAAIKEELHPGEVLFGAAEVPTDISEARFGLGSEQQAAQRLGHLLPSAKAEPARLIDLMHQQCHKYACALQSFLHAADEAGVVRVIEESEIIGWSARQGLFRTHGGTNFVDLQEIAGRFGANSSLERMTLTEIQQQLDQGKYVLTGIETTRGGKHAVRVLEVIKDARGVSQEVRFYDSGPGRVVRMSAAEFRGHRLPVRNKTFVFDWPH